MLIPYRNQFVGGYLDDLFHLKIRNQTQLSLSIMALSHCEMRMAGNLANGQYTNPQYTKSIGEIASFYLEILRLENKDNSH
jgi:hypothetical protein